MGSGKGLADAATAGPIFAAYKLVPEKPVDVISDVLNSKFFPHFHADNQLLGRACL